MVPVSKGHGNSRLKDNNRGITIGCIFAKLYEKLLVRRWEGWVKENGIIDELQGANQTSCSNLHTSWLLLEVISYNVERNSTVWVCLLDIRKAFDSVWIPGMLHTLYQTGIEGKLWWIIKDMYTCYVSCVRLDE